MTNGTNQVATKFLNLYKFFLRKSQQPAHFRSSSPCFRQALQSLLHTKTETFLANMKRKVQFGISELTGFFI